jgi:hypothetical protein
VLLEQLWVHDALGPGVDVESTLGPTSVALRGSLVEQNHEFGVFVLGAAATLEGVVARGTLPRASDQLAGVGILIQDAPGTGAPATALVTGSLVEQNHELGVVVASAEATLDGVLIRGTLPRALDGGFGDGLGVAIHIVQGMPRPATALVSHCRLRDNARAGIGTFGSHVALGQSSLSCNAFDLDGEVNGGIAFSFEDLGENACGCPEPSGACVVQSSGLAPPEPIVDPL